jgi:hypothetical protein
MSTELIAALAAGIVTIITAVTALIVALKAHSKIKGK